MMARRSTIEKLPEDVRRWLERALTESGFSGYNELESLLREQGYVISKSAIHRYGQKIERRYGAIRAATEAARMLTEGALTIRMRSEAVIALIQTELFESRPAAGSGRRRSRPQRARGAAVEGGEERGHAVPRVRQPQEVPV
jgi:hypothetical protein